MKSILALLIVAFLAAASAETIVEVLAAQPLYSQVSASLVGKPIETFLNETAITATFLPPRDQSTPLDLTNEQLSYHVLNGTKLNASQVADGELFVTALTLTSLKGGYQRIKASLTNASVFLGPNQVALNLTELEASNGVIYGVESPIALPGDLSTLVASVPTLSTLSAVLTTADIKLNDSFAAVTAFAPTNVAFAALNPLVYKYLTSDSGLVDLQSVLKLHVATSVVYSAQITTGSQTVPTLEGVDLTLTRGTTGVTVGLNADDAGNVVSADNLASNGVAHVIDKVLTPTTFQFNLGKALLGLGLTSFEEALQSFNLTQYLNNTTPFTLFAPTNAALAGKTATAELLKYHVVEGHQTAFKAGLLQSQLALPSGNVAYQQLEVTVNENVTVVNGVTLPAAQDAGTAIGVIYVIDTVLVPPSKTIVEIASSAGDFSQLVSAITNAGAAGALVETTVFAPVNSAFTGPVADYLLLNTNESNADLLNVLKFHVAADRDYYYVDGTPTIPATITTLNTQNLEVTVTNVSVILNGVAKITQANILASNGVVHAIDTVLIPNNVVLTADKVVQGFKTADFRDLVAKANLSYVLTGKDVYTVFAFTDAAYDSAPQDLIDNPSKWSDVLQTHIYNGSIDTLVAGENYTMLSGEVLEVISATSVQVRGSEGAGQPKIVGGPVVTSNGVVYAINGILTIKAAEKDDSGLSDTAIGFIVIGCIVGVLLIIGAAGGGYWYYRRRAGYDQIGDNSF